MSATLEQFRKIMASPNFTESEKFVVKVQLPEFGLPSRFERALWDLMAACDPKNFDRLWIAFPEQAEAAHSWWYGDLAERVRAAGCDI